jgi:tetratricopeptide (TPR) repeat protein
MNRAAVQLQVERARKMIQHRRLDEAERLLGQLLAASDRCAPALALLGRIAYERTQWTRALDLYGKAIAADRRVPGWHCQQGRLLQMLGRPREALAAYERALKLEPGFAPALASKADALERAGKRDRAVALLRPIVRAGRATPLMDEVYARALLGAGRTDDAVAHAERSLDSRSMSPPERRAILLLLGRARQRLGAHAAAFEAFRAANELVHQPFDEAAHRRAYEALQRVFTAETLAGLSRARVDTTLPVFVFGMPRSGTTLVEQILHAHPDAAGLGEIHDVAHLRTLVERRVRGGRAYPDAMLDLTPDAADELATSYLERRRAQAPGAIRVVDKSLENFECLGLIALLFPGAHLVHVVRHPLDCCLSCYFQGLNPRTHPYATDLAALGAFYRAYADLMGHWGRVLDMPILEVPYEALVADQEGWTRRIVEHVGLPWNDACLRFFEAERDVATLSYEQVRQPIYASAIGRYRHYADELAPLVAALGDALPPPADPGTAPRPNRP